MIYNRETDQSRGFGFVTMSSVEEAEKAVEMFHRYVGVKSFLLFFSEDLIGFFFISATSLDCYSIFLLHYF